MEIHKKTEEKREKGGVCPTSNCLPQREPPSLAFLQFLYGFPLFLLDFVTFFAFLGFQKVFLRFKGGQRSKNLKGGQRSRKSDREQTLHKPIFWNTAPP